MKTVLDDRASPSAGATATGIWDTLSLNKRFTRINHTHRRFTPEQRKAIWEKGKGICWICGRPADPSHWHADHKYPWSKGGRTSVRNGGVSHKQCNQKKSNAIPAGISAVEFTLEVALREMGRGALIGAATGASIEAVRQGYRLYKGTATYQEARVAVTTEAGIGATTGAAVALFGVAAASVSAPGIAVVGGGIIVGASVSIGTRKLIKRWSRTSGTMEKQPQLRGCFFQGIRFLGRAHSPKSELPTMEPLVPFRGQLPLPGGGVPGYVTSPRARRSRTR